MSLVDFHVSSAADRVIIRITALNAKKLDGFVRSITPNGAVSRNGTQVSHSVREWSFKPKLDATNMIDGVILNADLPGANVIRREIFVGGELVSSTTSNPKDFPASASAGGGIAQMSPEFFRFVKHT